MENTFFPPLLSFALSGLVLLLVFLHKLLGLNLFLKLSTIITVLMTVMVLISGVAESWPPVFAAATITAVVSRREML